MRVREGMRLAGSLWHRGGTSVALFCVSAVALTGCFGGGNDERKAALDTKSDQLNPPPKSAPKDVAPKFGESKEPPRAQPAEPAPELMGQPTEDAAWQKLKQKAEKDDLVPVIVSLKVKAKPEGALSAAERKAQRKNIGDARDAVLETVRGKGATNVKDFEVVPFVAMHVSAKALDALQRSPHVQGVSEDQLLSLPNPHQPDTEQSSGSAQATTSNEGVPLKAWWDLDDANVYTAWNNGYGGNGWTVGILDTGVEKTHAWLAGKVVYEACFSTFQVGSTAGYCPNGTWRQYGAGAASPCTYVAWSCSHGTHVAHIAAGKYGVARDASIIAIQVFHKDSACGTETPPCALSYTSDQLWGLKTIYDLRNTYRIAAVNLSIGGGGYTSYCDNINNDNASFYSWAATLRSVGIATVVSSGNDNYYNGLSSPACISSVVSVGNTTLTSAGVDAVFGYIKYGSNSASYLSVLAPGTTIYSAVPNNGAEYKTGTSMAAPHITGTFAVLKQLRPWATVDASLRAIQLSGKPIYDDRNGITRSRLNVWGALVSLYNS